MHAAHVAPGCPALRQSSQNGKHNEKRIARIMQLTPALFQVLNEMGRTWEAVQAATRATQLAPNCSDAFATLARAQLNLGEPALAAESFRVASALEPGNAGLRAEMAEARMLALQHRQQGGREGRRARVVARAALQHAMVPEASYLDEVDEADGEGGDYHVVASEEGHHEKGSAAAPLRAEAPTEGKE